MTAVSEPGPREVFQDVRGPERVLRTSWHASEGLVAFSVWSGRQCLTTFRLPVAEVPDLVGVLVRGLATGGPPSVDAFPRTGALEVATVPTTEQPVAEPPEDDPAG